MKLHFADREGNPDIIDDEKRYIFLMQMPIATKLRRQRLQRASKTVDVGGGSAGIAASAVGVGGDLTVEQVSF